MKLSELWQAWDRHDSGHFRYIATYGYTEWWRTAFFPLYPLGERALSFFTHSPLTAGLLISNIAGFIMLVVLYRLVEEDFGQERALRTVLYCSIFPGAFFLAAPYNESLFLCLSLLSFYCMRRSSWWLAGLFGFLASLTRSAGILLLVPFCYEYLRQHSFKLKAIRLDSISGLAIPAGLGVFALYCYLWFHDPLAFSHAQSTWLREYRFPGEGMILSLQAIRQSRGLLSFLAIHNMIDLGADLFMLVLIVLGFVGPWRLSRHLLAYSIYALICFLFLQLFPVMNLTPLVSIPRLAAEIFPAFIVLAGIGENRLLNKSYLVVSGSGLFFLLTQFLTGHWIT